MSSMGCTTMHACQIGPSDTATLAWDCLTGPVSKQGGGFEAGNLSASISPLLRVCGWFDYTLPLLDPRLRQTSTHCPILLLGC